MKINLNL